MKLWVKIYNKSLQLLQTPQPLTLVQQNLSENDILFRILNQETTNVTFLMTSFANFSDMDDREKFWNSEESKEKERVADEKVRKKSEVSFKRKEKTNNFLK